MALLDEENVKDIVQETCDSFLEEYEDKLINIKIALFKETLKANKKMKKLHNESEEATDEQKQFAVAQFAALYGFILNNNLYDEYNHWLCTSD